MKRATMVRLVATAVVVVATTSPARAHRGHDDRLKVRVVDREVRVEMSVAPDLLTEFDEDRDGIVRVREIASRPAEIEDWLDGKMALLGEPGRLYRPSFADAPIEKLSSSSPETPVGHLSVIRRYPLRGDEERLFLKVDLFERGSRSKPYVIVAGAKVRSGVLHPDTPVLQLLP